MRDSPPSPPPHTSPMSSRNRKRQRQGSEERGEEEEEEEEKCYGVTIEELDAIHAFIARPGESPPTKKEIHTRFLPRSDKWKGHVLVHVAQEAVVRGIEVERSKYIIMTKEEAAIMDRSAKTTFQFQSKPTRSMSWDDLVMNTWTNPIHIEMISHGTAIDDGKEFTSIHDIHCFALYMKQQKKKWKGKNITPHESEVDGDDGDGSGDGKEEARRGGGGNDDDDDDDDEEDYTQGSSGSSSSSSSGSDDSSKKKRTKGNKR